MSVDESKKEGGGDLLLCGCVRSESVERTFLRGVVLK